MKVSKVGQIRLSNAHDPDPNGDAIIGVGQTPESDSDDAGHAEEDIQRDHDQQPVVGPPPVNRQIAIQKLREDHPDFVGSNRDLLRYVFKKEHPEYADESNSVVDKAVWQAVPRGRP